MTLLREAPLPGDPIPEQDGEVAEQAGVVTVTGATRDLEAFSSAFAGAIAAHRHFDRQLKAVSA